METKQFPLRVVLSVTTRRLLTEPKGEHGHGLDDIYEILNYMTGDNLFTHQLPPAIEACGPFLLEKYPVLNKATAALGLLDAWMPSDRRLVLPVIHSWLAHVATDMGMSSDTMIDVPSLPEGIYNHMHPQQELVEMMGGDQDRVITVEIPPEDEET